MSLLGQQVEECTAAAVRAPAPRAAVQVLRDASGFSRAQLLVQIFPEVFRDLFTFHLLDPL